MPEILALIPARGGSKGVHRKNIHPLGGKPLIAWTVEAARQSESINRILISTDDPEIAEIGRGFGAEIPFLRPGHLALDNTPDLPVYLHTLSWLSEHLDYHPDHVVWLRPTSPLRTSQDVDAAIEILIAAEADCIRSVNLAHAHPYWMKQFDNERLIPFLPGYDETSYPRRQLLPAVYHLNGAVDVIRCTSVLPDGPLFTPNMLGYVMPVERSLDIDTELDFIIAEALISRRTA
ncbi:MAG: acylneuraminate cytidylyltransferase family protein [Caldilineales bacterium]|nr:acylneuraminate cytidylyltransferase family protein [Caldilineales bacterium]